MFHRAGVNRPEFDLLVVRNAKADHTHFEHAVNHVLTMGIPSTCFTCYRPAG